MPSLPRGSESYGPHTMQPLESQVLPNIKSAISAAGKMGGDPLFIQLC